MQKKVHVLFLFCMTFLMVCLTMEMSAKSVVSPTVMMEEQDGMQGDEAFLVPEAPFLFFASDYITPLSSSPGTAPEIPDMKCVNSDFLLLHLLYFCRSDKGLDGGGYFCPYIFTDKDYYVLALRRIVV